MDPSSSPQPVNSRTAALRHAVHSGCAVRVTGLRKSYRSRRRVRLAVADLDLTVPLGGVHGFLGPNGAGKTTTIRMMLGLVRPDAGEITVFGHSVPAELSQVIGRIGAIVEQPRFFPGFTGRRNLEVLATGIDVPLERVGRVLDEVGLGDRGQDRFRGYSLGMKQRLAVAATLLKDPDLLIFDEPTNGLDPAGIHEIRATMRGLADRGKTVLVSSHILSEVQQLADTVSIIGRGRLLAEGAVGDILAAGGGQAVRLVVADPGAATEVLTDAGFSVTPLAENRLEVRPGAGPPAPDAPAPDPSAPNRPPTDQSAVDPARINELLADRRLFLSELVTVRADLESVFLELTAADGLDADPTASRPGSTPDAQEGHR